MKKPPLHLGRRYAPPAPRLRNLTRILFGLGDKAFFPHKAGGLGIEPKFSASKADVLPLDDPPALCANRFKGTFALLSERQKQALLTIRRSPNSAYAPELDCPESSIIASSSGNCGKGEREVSMEARMSLRRVSEFIFDSFSFENFSRVA